MTLIETSDKINNNTEKKGKGERSPREITWFFWIIDIFTIFFVGLCFIPEIKYFICWLLPSITLIIIALYIGYYAVEKEQQEIERIKIQDPGFFVGNEFGNGVAMGSIFIFFMSVGAGIVIAIIWGIILLKDFSFFFN